MNTPAQCFLQPAIAHAIEVLVGNDHTLAPLQEEDARVLLQYMYPFTIPAGEPFILEEDSSSNDFMLLVLLGEVVAEGTATGIGAATHIMGIPGEGQWVGEMALMDNAPRNATCRVAQHTDVDCAILRRADFLRLLDDRPRVAAQRLMVLGANLSHRLAILMGRCSATARSVLLLRIPASCRMAKTTRISKSRLQQGIATVAAVIAVWQPWQTLAAAAYAAPPSYVPNW